MKRALTALPFLALLLGLALFLFRRDGALSPPPGPGTLPAPSTSAPQPPKDPAKPAPAADPRPPSQEPGAIHFIITLRGHPAAGVPIVVKQSGSGTVMNFKAEADGTQLLKGLPPGEYAYSVLHEDAMELHANTLVQPGATVTVQVDLKPGGKVYGTVTNSAGQPVPGTRIFLLDERTKAPPNDAVAISDKDGG